MDIDRKLTKRHSSIFDGELVRCKDRSQSFLPLTIQMCRNEAIEWASNTKRAWLATEKKSWFNPLIIKHEYETMTLYLIARPVEDGWKANEANESVWEILIN
jgi:hypothetical protein